MNAPAQILQFKGAVKWASGPGSAGITLLGKITESDGQFTAAQLSLLCSEPLTLPANLTDVSVDLRANGEVQLRSGASEWRVHCNTWQLHRDVGAAFFAAVPPRPTPWTRRVSWRVLLGVAATAP